MMRYQITVIAAGFDAAKQEKLPLQQQVVDVAGVKPKTIPFRQKPAEQDEEDSLGRVVNSGTDVPPFIDKYQKQYRNTL